MVVGADTTREEFVIEKDDLMINQYKFNIPFGYRLTSIETLTKFWQTYEYLEPIDENSKETRIWRLS